MRPWASVASAATLGAASLGLGDAKAQGSPPMPAEARASTSALPSSLTGQPGDAVRGRAVVASRGTGLCLLCHAAPIAEERFQGNLGPDLAGVGARQGAGELRQRLLDPRALNPDSIMPPVHRTEGLTRVGQAWKGKPVLTSQQVEDVVAYLQTLR